MDLREDQGTLEGVTPDETEKGYALLITTEKGIDFNNRFSKFYEIIDIQCLVGRPWGSRGRWS